MLTLSAFALAACGQTPAAQAQSFNDAQAVEQIRGRLLGRIARGPIGQKRACTEFFDIVSVVIKDKRVLPDAAQVEVAAMVRSKYRMANGAAAATDCYGDVPGGWQVGQQARDNETFQFERWQSGWRLAP